MVFEKLKNTGYKAINKRWVIIEKKGRKVSKARLVARGFEEASNCMLTLVLQRQ